MATSTSSGVKLEIEVWYDRASRTITFSSDDRDLGPQGMTGSFRPVNCWPCTASCPTAPSDRTHDTSTSPPAGWPAPVAHRGPGTHGIRVTGA